MDFHLKSKKIIQCQYRYHFSQNDIFFTKKRLQNEKENSVFVKTFDEHVHSQLLEIDLYTGGGLDQ